METLTENNQEIMQENLMAFKECGKKGKTKNKIKNYGCSKILWIK
jgi:hypothetical protein